MLIRRPRRTPQPKMSSDQLQRMFRLRVNGTAVGHWLLHLRFRLNLRGSTGSLPYQTEYDCRLDTFHRPVG